MLVTPRLLLLNGPPGIGKSTVAARYVAEHPLALRLDADEIRRLLGQWEADDRAVGLLARDLVLAMARTHLLAGYAVVVPQFVARAAFADAMAAIAAETRAAFSKLVLMDDRSAAVARFAARAADPALAAHHREAAARAGDTLPALYDALVAFVATRPRASSCARSPATSTATYRSVLAAVAG